MSGKMGVSEMIRCKCGKKLATRQGLSFSIGESELSRWRRCGGGQRLMGWGVGVMRGHGGGTAVRVGHVRWLCVRPSEAGALGGEGAVHEASNKAGEKGTPA